MRTLIKTLKLSLLCLLFVHCSSNDFEDSSINSVERTKDDSIILSNANELLGFSVSTENNQNLGVDATVYKSDTRLKLFFPANTDLTNLVVSFQVSENAILKIDGIELVNNGSAVDFSSDFSTIVEAENGSMQEYFFTAESNFTSLDSSIELLRRKHDVPGMQIAITKGEKLVYANNYGFANLDGTASVTQSSIFRIASISKPVTAIAILKMVDEGFLSLNDTVFGDKGILGTDFGTAPYGTNIENITVRHLLDHTSGFVNDAYDPMFVNLEWSQKQVIDDVIDNWTLATVPGETYHYSNFGYLVLGRIIEKLAGTPYADYVKQSVLMPSGIKNMSIAGNLLTEKKENEVEYYGQETLSAYEMNIARMDAHGGWVGSATDLARLLVRIDRQSEVEDLVTTSNLNELYFGFGNWWFAGSLPGTSAVFGRLNGEFNYVILENTRTFPDDFELIRDMQFTLGFYIPKRFSWPKYDLFTAK